MGKVMHFHINPFHLQSDQKRKMEHGVLALIISKVDNQPIRTIHFLIYFIFIGSFVHKASHQRQ